MKTLYRPSSKIEAFYAGGAIALSSDGLFVACAFYDEIKVVETATGQVKQTLAGDTEPITALAFGSTAETLYSASRSLQISSWDVPSGLCKKSWKGHSAPVAHMCVEASGGLLATASADKCVRVWNLQGHFCTHVFRGHSGVVMRVLFQPQQPQELRVISAAEDGEVRVWDLVSQQCKATLKAHFTAVTSISMAPDGWTLLSAGRDKVVVLWDLRTNTKLATLAVFEAVEGAQFIPSAILPHPQSGKSGSKGGKKDFHIATAGATGLVKVWSSLSGKCIAQEHQRGPFEEGSQLTTLELCNGKSLMSATEDARITFLEFQANGSSGEAGCSVTMTKEWIGNQGEVTDLEIVSTSGRPSHLAVATNSAVVRIYNLAGGGCQASLFGHSDMVLALDLVAAGEGQAILASASKDCTFRIWRLQDSSRCVMQTDGDLQCSLLATAKDAHSAAVTAVALSRKNAGEILLSVSSDKMLKLWNTKASINGTSEGPELLQSTAAVTAHEKDINSVTLSPNELLVCTTSQDKTAKIWKLPSLVLLLKLSGHRRGVWDASFSPLEQIVATSSGDKTIKLWSIADGSCLRTLQGHTSSVLRLHYMEAGTQILSSGAEGLLKLWDVRSGECTASFEEHEGKVWALASGGSSDSVIASGGADSTIFIWEDASQHQLEEASNAKLAEIAANQEFHNALQDGHLDAAAKLAFHRKQPKLLLSVINRAQDSGRDTMLAVLEHMVAKFEGEDFKHALEILRDWNTQTRDCYQAQALLNTMLVHHSPKALLEVSGLEDLLAGIGPYSQRHIAHLDRLLCSSFVIDYSLSRLSHISEGPDARM